VPPRKYMNKALVKNEKKKTEYVRINFKIASVLLPELI